MHVTIHHEVCNELGLVAHGLVLRNDIAARSDQITMAEVTPESVKSDCVQSLRIGPIRYCRNKKIVGIVSLVRIKLLEDIRT